MATCVRCDLLARNERWFDRWGGMIIEEEPRTVWVRNLLSHEYQRLRCGRCGSRWDVTRDRSGGEIGKHHFDLVETMAA